MEKIVYTTESGTQYTYSEVLDIAKGNEKYANLLLERATWQHIETLVDEDLLNDEITQINNTYILNN
jgi:hypothetical protein